MKKENIEIRESIRQLFKKKLHEEKEKEIHEDKDIQRVDLPADADAREQHAEAQKQNAERRNPDNYDKEVKELIQETASEESRYRHFDVVDRKELAKRINEAKEKGLDWKVSRSTKEGFRYDFRVLSEDLQEGLKEEEKKDEFVNPAAGDPEVNKDAFNHATDVGASSPTCAEDLEEDWYDQEPEEEFEEDDFDTVWDEEPLQRERPKIDGSQLGYDLVNWFSEHEQAQEDAMRYLHKCGWSVEDLNAIFVRGDALIEGLEEGSSAFKKAFKNGGEDLDDYLDGQAIARVKDPDERERLIATKKLEGKGKLGDRDSVEDELARKENQAQIAYEKKAEQAAKAGLEEDLKVYTGTLDGFIPSEQSKDLWNEIKDANKVETLEYALETLYPDGISDVALDDMLKHEEDWIRDLIDLPFNPDAEESHEEEHHDEVEDDEWEEPVDELDYYDDDVEPLGGEEGHNFDEFEDEEEIEAEDEPLPADDDESWDEEPLDLEPEEKQEESLNENKEADEKKKLKYLLAKEDCCPLDKEERYELQSLIQKYGKPDSQEECLKEDNNDEDDVAPVIVEDKDVEQQAQPEQTLAEEKQPEEKKAEETIVVEEKEDEKLDDQTDSLAESFVKNQFKPNDIIAEATTAEEKEANQKKLTEAAVASDDDEEVVVIDDNLVEDLMGFQHSDAAENKEETNQENK